MWQAASWSAALAAPQPSSTSTQRNPRSAASRAVPSTQELVETPVNNSWSTPHARTRRSKPEEWNALMVVLLSRASRGSGASASRISCSRRPRVLPTASAIGRMWGGRSLKSGSSEPTVRYTIRRPRARKKASSRWMVGTTTDSMRSKRAAPCSGCPWSFSSRPRPSWRDALAYCMSTTTRATRAGSRRKPGLNCPA